MFHPLNIEQRNMAMGQPAAGALPSRSWKVPWHSLVVLVLEKSRRIRPEDIDLPFLSTTAAEPATSSPQPLGVGDEKSAMDASETPQVASNGNGKAAEAPVVAPSRDKRKALLSAQFN